MWVNAMHEFACEKDGLWNCPFHGNGPNALSEVPGTTARYTALDGPRARTLSYGGVIA